MAGKRHRRRVVLLSRQQVGAAAVRHAGQAPVQRLEHVHGSNPRNQRQHRWQPRRTRGAAPRFPKQPENPPRTDSWRCAAGAVHVLLPGRNLRRAFYQEHARRGGRLCVGAASRSPASFGVWPVFLPLSFCPLTPSRPSHVHMLTVSHVASRVPRGVPVLVAARVTCWLVLSTCFYAELSSSLPFSFFWGCRSTSPITHTANSRL